MHVDFTFHFWSVLGWLASFAAICRFLLAVYKEIRRGVTAFTTLINEHHEVYGWYSTHVKPKRKTNGDAFGLGLN